MLHETQFEWQKCEIQYEACGRVLHSSEALPKSNIIPDQRRSFARAVAILRAFPASAYPLKTPTPCQQFAHDTTLHLLVRPKPYPLTEASEPTWPRASRATQFRTTMGRPGTGLSGCARATGVPWHSGRDCVFATLRSEPARFHERFPFRARFVDLVGMYAVVLRRSQQEGTVLRLQVFAGGLVAIDGVLSETFCQLSRISNRHGPRPGET